MFFTFLMKNIAHPRIFVRRKQGNVSKTSPAPLKKSNHLQLVALNTDHLRAAHQLKQHRNATT